MPGAGANLNSGIRSFAVVGVCSNHSREVFVGGRSKLLQRPHCRGWSLAPTTHELPWLEFAPTIHELPGLEFAPITHEKLSFAAGANSCSGDIAVVGVCSNYSREVFVGSRSKLLQRRHWSLLQPPTNHSRTTHE